MTLTKPKSLNYWPQKAQRAQKVQAAISGSGQFGTTACSTHFDCTAQIVFCFFASFVLFVAKFSAQ